MPVHRFVFIACLWLVCGFSEPGGSFDEPDAGPEIQAADLIVGVWMWTRQSNGCTEVYRFYRDGTFAVISGKEVVLGEYEIASEPNEAGRYKLTDTVRVDHAGMDCGNQDVDSTGESASVYILFHESGNAYWPMYDPVENVGYGRLFRIAR